VKPELRKFSIQRRDAENAEISAEKTENKIDTNPAALPASAALRFSLRSLRLCVEKAFTQ
jgi:hypothetical protein